MDKSFLLDLTDLSDVNDTNTFSLCVCVQGVSPPRQCNYAPPSHPTLLFSFRAERVSATPQRKLTLLFSFRAQRASGTQRILTHFLFVFVCSR